MSTHATVGNSGGAAGNETTQQTMKMSISLPSTAITIETESELIKRALELPEILEEILRKLNKKNIRNCRSVSKTWNNVAKGILKNQVYLRRMENLEMLQDFCDTIKSSVEGISLPFQHLNFYADTIPTITIESPLNSVKQHVTRLQWSAEDKMGSVDEMLQLIYNHFPNLKKVDIEFSGSTKAMEALPSDFEATMIPYAGKPLLPLEDLCFAVRVAQPGRHLNRVNCFFKTLIASAVNLKYLSLNSLYTKGRARIQENVISSITSCNIQKIEMEYFWTTLENVDALSNHHLDFPLTKLRLEIDLDQVDLKPLLKRCSPYLMELELSFAERHAHVNFPFGVNLNKLWSLELTCAKGQFYIDWSRMPQIRKLVLVECALNGIVASMISSPSHCPHLLKTLQILPFGHLDVQLLSPLLIQMHLNSQLTSLQLNVYWDIKPPLALIFRECTSLKYLDLWLSREWQDWNGKIDDNDHLLCGVKEPNMLTVTWPENNCKDDEDTTDLDADEDEASLDFPYHCLVNQVKHPDGAPHRQFPYIGNLKELQLLVLHGYFTELALLHGIVHCRNLTRMYLDSPLICRKRAARIIRNADLIHLKSAKVKNQLISHHLPGESVRELPIRKEPPPPTTTVPKVKSKCSLVSQMWL